MYFWLSIATHVKHHIIVCMHMHTKWLKPWNFHSLVYLTSLFNSILIDDPININYADKCLLKFHVFSLKLFIGLFFIFRFSTTSTGKLYFILVWGYDNKSSPNDFLECFSMWFFIFFFKLGQQSSTSCNTSGNNWHSYLICNEMLWKINENDIK